jgi:acyl-CoA synthetase (AMP-forming)/AMP-acid ligase II
MLLFSPLMILGCAQSGAVRVPLSPANTQDLAATRCPPLDARVAAEFKSTTPAPAGDVTKRASQEWLDKFEEAERRKNKAGQRLAKEYEACRSGGAGWQSTLATLPTS